MNALEPLLLEAARIHPLPPLVPRAVAPGAGALRERIMNEPGLKPTVRAGLLLRIDDLDGSHTLSQSIETATGSYWHGIMHRREPDYSNAGYWFRRVGRHPVFAQLAEAVASFAPAGLVGSGGWDPFAFTRACEQGVPDEVLRRIQLVEMELLLRYSEAEG